jgi:uncharacterized protein YndB with AHSA1/START domain
MSDARDIIVDAPAEKVWSVLTDVDLIAKWFGEADHDIDKLAPGGLMTFKFKQGSELYARIIEVEPERVFSYRVISKVTEEEPTDANSRLIRFTLAPEGDKTRLGLEESNSHLDAIKGLAENL